MKKPRGSLSWGRPCRTFCRERVGRKRINCRAFQSDIKPGGLAEYGIYPEKTRLKRGCATSFMNIECSWYFYFGNTFIGEKFPVDWLILKKLGFSAILVAAGHRAQNGWAGWGRQPGCFSRQGIGLSLQPFALMVRGSLPLAKGDRRGVGK